MSGIMDQVGTALSETPLECAHPCRSRCITHREGVRQKWLCILQIKKGARGVPLQGTDNNQIPNESSDQRTHRYNVSPKWHTRALILTRVGSGGNFGIREHQWSYLFQLSLAH